MNNQLETMDKRMPYTVPQGFFEDMAARIGNAVDRTQRRQRRATIVKWTMSGAAAVIVAVITLIAIKPTTTLTPQDNDFTIASLSDDELDQWITIDNNDVFLMYDDELEIY